MKIAILLLCLALVHIVSSTTISLEEGQSDTKRIFKWIVDPKSPAFPLPRFILQDGAAADFRDFRFLGTLDCSALTAGEVGMAIYDPTIDDWNCTATSKLPNDTSVPSNVTTGLPLNCTRSFVAVWNSTTTEWGCSPREALLYQSEGNIQDLCRSGDLLTINYDETVDYIDRPAGLCDDPSTREVGPNASLKRKKNSLRNPGDPDEAFYVQTTSKAIGGLGSTGGAEHFNWQYWAWSPVKTSFSASVGTFPPVIPFANMHLVAVTSSVLAWSSNVYTVSPSTVSFRVVELSVHFTGSYPSISYMQYIPTDFTATLTQGVTVYSNTTATIPGTALTQGNALSIRLITIPTGLTGTPKSVWFTASLWVSQIVKELAT